MLNNLFLTFVNRPQCENLVSEGDLIGIYYSNSCI